MTEQEKNTAQRIYEEYDRGIKFNTNVNLYDTVENNENFYVGKQWEGVVSNGLPTPVFNFIKRIVMYLVASTATDNIKINASPLSSSSAASVDDVEHICAVVNAQFSALFEQNKVGKRIRDFMRNAAVDGDGCLYTYFDPDVETGQTAKGAIRLELIENTRVQFGNPNKADVQSQPFIIVSRREDIAEVKDRAEQFGGEPDGVKTDTDDNNDRFDAMVDGKVTTIMKFWKDKKTRTIHAKEVTRDSVIRPEWDTELKLYPIVWMSWDYVQNCYHGQAAVTGLIPNQIFVNKAFAMTMISLMTTAYPKVVYDKTRVSKWDSRVGAAIPVNGGDVTGVAKNLDPATISPQVSQFIQAAIDYTKEFMGATDAALGDTRPDNTSAIIALQKASSVPMELTKQNLFQSVEDLGNIWLDMMRVYFGARFVDVKKPMQAPVPGMPMQMPVPEDRSTPTLFDFKTLNDIPLALKLDVGGSAYWSEIAQMNTLDNLLTQNKIGIVDYLERVPSGYISNQQELIDKLRRQEAGAMNAQAPVQGDGTASNTSGVMDFNLPDDVSGGSGYGRLQRILNTTGAEGLNLSAK